MIKLLIATTLGISGLIAFTPDAEAFAPGETCLPLSALNIIAQVKRGGGTPHQAVQAAYDEGYFDGTEICAIRLSGVIDKYGLD